MIRNLILLLCASFLCVSGLQAQHRVCGSSEVLARQLLENPSLRQQMEDIEQHSKQFAASAGLHGRTVVTIPVVVHVVWKTAVQNISEAQIQSQLTVLNADFRKLNADVANTPSAFAGLVADCEINFCLATQTPSGAVTTGIERRQTTVTAFSTNDNVKRFANGGLDAWDASKYLNLWVCNLSGGVLGYAQFPGGGPASTDGVVITYTGFGTNGSAAAPFNKGRTATHEVGHWLNLFHIWGDDGAGCNGSDNCADTPNQADENYGCPAFPQESCNNGLNGDLFMNYMDYTDDACMFMFTNGQKTRMQALFGTGGARVSLLTSPGCQAGGGSCGTPAGLNATAVTQTSATLGWGAVSGASAYNLQWKLSSASTWTTVSGLTGTNYGLSGLSAGSTYNYKIQAVCGSTSGNYSAASSFTTQPAAACADQYEANETRTTAKVIPVNTTFTAQIATAPDKDWYKFSNTTATKNIKIELTTLPFDYDVKLYLGNSQLAVSENGSTTSEQIIYNTSTVASNYYAYVYGYNNAFSSSQCYTLRVSLNASNWREDGSANGSAAEIEIPVIFENAGFGLFPNPANEQLTVEVPMEAENEVAVSILDATGRVALQQQRVLGKSDNRLLFDLKQLPGGFYLVQVRNAGVNQTRKLTVRH